METIIYERRWSSRRGRGLAAPGLGLLILLVGCFHDTPVDPGEVGEPGSTLSAEAMAQAALNAFPPGALGLQDIFADMARRVPGGFGGLYYDEDGRLTLVLTDPSLQAEARAALQEEAFVQDRESRAADGSFQVSHAEVRGATFDSATLDRWFRLIMYELDIVPASTSVDVRANRISVGVVDEAHLQAVERARSRVGVPQQALLARIVHPPQVAREAPHSSHLLTDRHRPVPGGVRIEGPSPCTIGPNLQWHAYNPAHPDSTQATFLVNSHCTDNPYNGQHPDSAMGPGTKFHQHEKVTLPGGVKPHLLGQEGLDPQAEPCPTLNPTFGCRGSDAALAIFHDHTAREFGRIARPGARNPGSGHTLIDTQDPRFEVVAREEASLQGQTLEKVGVTTGWSGGVVWDRCEHNAQFSGGQLVGPTILCGMRVQGAMAGGDSGAPIFRVLGEDPESGLDVELRGTAWGNVWCDGQGPPVCFLGSNLGGIEQDLDPMWQSGLFPVLARRTGLGGARMEFNG